MIHFSRLVFQSFSIIFFYIYKNFHVSQLLKQPGILESHPLTESQQCGAVRAVLQLNLPPASCIVASTVLWYCLSSTALPFLVCGPFCFMSRPLSQEVANRK